MNLANASPVLLQLRGVGCDTASLPTVDVSIPEIHSVCSLENAGDLKIKALIVMSLNNMELGKLEDLCSDLWLQGAGSQWPNPGWWFL